MITFEDIKRDEAIKVYIKKADEALGALGYTEHSFSHVLKVADTAMYILRALGHSEHEVELAGIAGYTHDIGNLVNRADHSQSGAVMAFRILDRMDFPPEEIAVIISAIGNHDEGTGIPVDPVAAALIIADKSDVRRSRVRNPEDVHSDIHDRVNYAVTENRLVTDVDQKEITLHLTIDENFCTMYEYFDIFLQRMLMSRSAAEMLSTKFSLNVNGNKVL